MKTAPKVTLQEIMAGIKKEEFTVLSDGRTTLCMLTLDNGFTILGESACVSLGNYDQKLGEFYSKEAAVRQCWAYFGFRLADRVHQARLKKGRGVRYRDASSGTYVTKEYAKLNLKTTVRET